MAGLLAGTDLAAVQLPDDVTGFGVAEVAYLLSRHKGPATERSAGLLLDRDDVTGVLVRTTGASSLLARGLVEMDADHELFTRSAAALFEYAAGAARRWTTVGILSGAGRDLGLVLQAPGVVSVLQPRPLGTWFAGFSGAADQPAQAVLPMLRKVVADRPEASVALVSSTLDGDAGAVFVRWDDEHDRWDTVDQTADPDNERRELLDDLALTGRLAQLLRPVEEEAQEPGGRAG